MRDRDDAGLVPPAVVGTSGSGPREGITLERYDQVTSNTLPIIKRITVGDQVVEVLREMIFSGRLQPGEHLSQGKLASELGVSRTPLRQALVKLQEEGLVRVSGTRQVEVTKLDAKELLELYDVRGVVEGLAANLAATHMGPSEIGELKLILDRMASLGQPPDVHEWLMLNLQFHESILQASRNRFVQQLSSMVTMSSRMIFRVFVISPERMKVNYEQHLDIYEAIAAGDPGRAEAAARAHLVSSKEVIRQLARNPAEQRRDFA